MKTYFTYLIIICGLFLTYGCETEHNLPEPELPMNLPDITEREAKAAELMAKSARLTEAIEQEVIKNGLDPDLGKLAVTDVFKDANNQYYYVITAYDLSRNAKVVFFVEETAKLTRIVSCNGCINGCNIAQDRSQNYICSDCSKSSTNQFCVKLVTTYYW